VRAVVDTNVLVSGLINAVGSPGRVVDLLRSGVLEVVVDDRILAEYDDVLRRDRFRSYFSERDCEDILEFLRENSWRTTSRVVVLDLPDPGDAPFLEMAISEGVPLITGNERHFPPEERGECEVLDPEAFLRRFFLVK
jgi:uncharacterized protein